MRNPGSSMGVVCAAVACWIGSVAGDVSASSVRTMNDVQLVRQSSVIIEGRVLEVSSAWNAARTQIHTRVIVAIKTVLKGNIGQRRTMTLTVLGGQVGDTVMEVVGGNTYAVGEEAFMFINNPGALLPITGLHQGKLPIRLDPISGQESVSLRDESRRAFRTRIATIVATHARQQEGK